VALIPALEWTQINLDGLDDLELSEGASHVAASRTYPSVGSLPSFEEAGMLAGVTPSAVQLLWETSLSPMRWSSSQRRRLAMSEKYVDSFVMQSRSRGSRTTRNSLKRWQFWPRNYGALEYVNCEADRR
jgi:hypothetical protein